MNDIAEAVYVPPVPGSPDPAYQVYEKVNAVKGDLFRVLREALEDVMNANAGQPEVIVMAGINIAVQQARDTGRFTKVEVMDVAWHFGIMLATFRAETKHSGSTFTLGAFPDEM